MTESRWQPMAGVMALACVLLGAPGSARAQPPAAASPSSTVAAAQTAPTPPAMRPPLPNRLNEVLPSWLRMRGEFRERLEGVQGSGFVAGRDDAYALSRFRFNATVTVSPLVSFQVQAQDARVTAKQVGSTAAPFTGTFDLRMAFADIGTSKSPVAVRVGRQELAYGEQRLVGPVGWLNTARTFDGARATLRGRAVQLDLFGASVVRILDKQFDKSGNGHTFLGAYATAGTLIPRSSVEPFVFWRGDRAIRTEAGALADLRAATVGARWTGRLPGRLDYGIEMAAQTGSVGSDSIGACGGHWQLREALPGIPTFRVIGEYNFASGDKDPTDGKRGTFDQLYPTPHDKYGLSDQIGWRNIHHVRGGVELPPYKTFAVTANAHAWWLAETRDGLYNAGGISIARVVSGARSSHVGQEIDVQVGRPLTPQLQLLAGYAHIFPGAFLEEATPGASYKFPYVMLTYVFLADK